MTSFPMIVSIQIFLSERVARKNPYPYPTILSKTPTSNLENPYLSDVDKELSLTLNCGALWVAINIEEKVKLVVRWQHLRGH